MSTDTTTYVYLVGYLHDKGFGRATIQWNTPLNSIEEIDAVDARLTEKNGFDCHVFTFTLLQEIR